MLVQDGIFLFQVNYEREARRKCLKGAIILKAKFVYAANHVTVLFDQQAVQIFFMHPNLQIPLRRKPFEVMSQIRLIPDAIRREGWHQHGAITIECDKLINSTLIYEASPEIWKLNWFETNWCVVFFHTQQATQIVCQFPIGLSS